MRITDAGRVGIGTTSPDVPFQVEAGQNVLVQLEATHTDGNARMLFKPKDNNGWNIGANDDGSFTIFDVVASTNSVVVETGAAASTLVVDSNSRVCVGTASPSTKLDVVGNIASTGVATPEFELVPTGSVGNADIKFDGTTFDIRSNSSSAALTLQTASTERMRIDSSGNVTVGVSTFADGTGGTSIAGGLIKISNDSTSSGTQMFFTNPNGAVGSISSSGSATAFNTSSDARLKDVTGSARGLEVINELNPVAYNWKVDGKANEGLIAQEVLDVVPNAVSGSEEDMYQMDYSKLVVHLVAGMKEQQKQIEALQSEINELKNS